MNPASDLTYTNRIDLLKHMKNQQVVMSANFGVG